MIGNCLGGCVLGFRVGYLTAHSKRGEMTNEWRCKPKNSPGGLSGQISRFIFYRSIRYGFKVMVRYG